jgi:hypothetical protein
VLPCAYCSGIGFHANVDKGGGDVRSNCTNSTERFAQAVLSSTPSRPHVDSSLTLLTVTNTSAEQGQELFMRPYGEVMQHLQWVYHMLKFPQQHTTASVTQCATCTVQGPYPCLPQCPSAHPQRCARLWHQRRASQPQSHPQWRRTRCQRFWDRQHHGPRDTHDTHMTWGQELSTWFTWIRFMRVWLDNCVV